MGVVSGVVMEELVAVIVPIQFGEQMYEPVSYTHLTLPTILLV